MTKKIPAIECAAKPNNIDSTRQRSPRRPSGGAKTSKLKPTNDELDAYQKRLIKANENNGNTGSAHALSVCGLRGTWVNGITGEAVLERKRDQNGAKIAPVPAMRTLKCFVTGCGRCGGPTKWEQRKHLRKLIEAAKADGKTVVTTVLHLDQSHIAACIDRKDVWCSEIETRNIFFQKTVKELYQTPEFQGWTANYHLGFEPAVVDTGTKWHFHLTSLINDGQSELPPADAVARWPGEWRDTTEVDSAVGLSNYVNKGLHPKKGDPPPLLHATQEDLDGMVRMAKARTHLVQFHGPLWRTAKPKPTMAPRKPRTKTVPTTKAAGVAKLAPRVSQPLPPDSDNFVSPADSDCVFLLEDEALQQRALMVVPIGCEAGREIYKRLSRLKQIALQDTADQERVNLSQLII